MTVLFEQGNLDWRYEPFKKAYTDPDEKNDYISVDAIMTYATGAVTVDGQTASSSILYYAGVIFNLSILSFKTDSLLRCTTNLRGAAGEQCKAVENRSVEVDKCILNQTRFSFFNFSCSLLCLFFYYFYHCVCTTRCPANVMSYYLLSFPKSLHLRD